MTQLTIMIIAVVVLSAALIFLAAALILIKRDIRLLSRSLDKIGHSDTNMRLTTSTFDSDVSGLCGIVNGILDERKKSLTHAENLNRELRQAITNISHDLRTPLTSAVGYVQMIKSSPEKLTEEKTLEYAEIVERRLVYLSELMNKLFEYTQILEGRKGYELEKTNLCNVLCDVLSVYYEDFTEKSFKVAVDLPASPVSVICDTEALKRITQNLIQNVLNHGTEYFSLSVSGDGNTAVFENRVKNAPEVDTERLFDRFYTSDFSRIKGNTGLGLAITRELVKNMGWEIEAKLDNDILKIYIKYKAV